MTIEEKKKAEAEAIDSKKQKIAEKLYKLRESVTRNKAMRQSTTNKKSIDFDQSQWGTMTRESIEGKDMEPSRSKTLERHSRLLNKGHFKKHLAVKDNKSQIMSPVNLQRPLRSISRGSIENTHK
jgi:hypothetical protein